MSITIIDMPCDIIDIIISKIIDSEIVDYYKQLLSVKLSCRTLFKHLINLNYFEIIKYYFEITNLIYRNNMSFVNNSTSKLCANPDCYYDTKKYWYAIYRSRRYIHSRKPAENCSHYCMFCTNTISNFAEININTNSISF